MATPPCVELEVIYERQYSVLLSCGLPTAIAYWAHEGKSQINMGSSKWLKDINIGATKFCIWKWFSERSCLQQLGAQTSFPNFDH